jgi:hypothetical protein
MACSCDDAIPHTEAAAAAKLHDAKTTSSSTVRPTSSVAASIMFLPPFPAHAECLQGCHLPPFLLLHPPDFCYSARLLDRNFTPLRFSPSYLPPVVCEGTAFEQPKCPCHVSSCHWLEPINLVTWKLDLAEMCPIAYDVLKFFNSTSLLSFLLTPRRL